MLVVYTIYYAERLGDSPDKIKSLYRSQDYNETMNEIALSALS